jgi:hypothetical protein
MELLIANFDHRKIFIMKFSIINNIYNAKQITLKGNAKQCELQGQH